MILAHKRTVYDWAALWVVGAVWAQASAEPLVFETFSQVRDRSAQTDRVTVVYFTADWCAYCHRMWVSTFTDPCVRDLAPRFNWVKVNIDAEPQIAASFGVVGVPAVAMINVQDELLHMQDGYMGADAMVALLAEFVNQSGATGLAQQRSIAARRTARHLHEAANRSEAKEAVIEAVMYLAGSDASVCNLVQNKILNMHSQAWPGLVSCLRSHRLAVRAAAYDLLLQLADIQIEFDPFGEPESRSAGAQQWQGWLTSSVNLTDDALTPKQELSP